MATARRGIRHLIILLALSAILTTLTVPSAHAIGVGCSAKCKDDAVRAKTTSLYE